MQLSKHIYILASFIFVLLVLGLAFFSDKIADTSKANVNQNQAAEKLYVALEGDGAIAVIDTKDNSLLGKIDLTDGKGDMGNAYSAHNVQVAPDGKSIWVTANFMGLRGHEKESNSAENEETEKAFSDQVIVIDPQKDTIVKRIDIGTDQHLAHIIIS